MFFEIFLKMFQLVRSRTDVQMKTGMWANSVDPDEAAHHELPQQDLRYLQFELLSILAL